MLFTGTASSPYNPQTPGSSMESGHGSGVFGSEWHTTDIEVRVRDSNQDSDLAGQQGYVTTITVSCMLKVSHKFTITIIYYAVNFSTGWNVHGIFAARG
jgi:hypothetical protein